MNTRPLTLALAIACAAPLLAAPAADAKTPKKTMTQEKPMSHAAADARFLNSVDADNARELAAASLAVDRASSTAVRDFARRLLTDHQGLQTKVASTASVVGVTLTEHGTATAMGATNKNEQGMAGTENAASGGGSASTMSMPEDPTVRALSNKQGTEFDRAFIAQMVSDHKKDITEFQRASTDQKLSASVRTLASDTLPALREHLKAAQALEMAK